MLSGIFRVQRAQAVWYISQPMNPVYEAVYTCGLFRASSCAATSLNSASNLDIFA